MAGMEAVRLDTGNKQDYFKTLNDMIEVDPYFTFDECQPMMFNGMFMDNNPLSQRWQRSYEADISSYFNNTDVQQGIINNPEALAHLTEELEDKNTFIKRFLHIEREELPALLNGSDPAKTIGLVKTYGIKKGNPAALIEDTENLFFISAKGQNNSNVELIADSAIKTRHGETAALLVMESGDGWGANTAILNKIFVESKEKMSEAEYNRFIVDTAENYKRLTGESITKFIKSNYSRIGIRIFGLNLFGTEKEGKEYVNIINKAYKTNEGSNNNYTMMQMGMMPGMLMGGY